MRPYTRADYAELASWYLDRELGIPDPEMLPANGAFEPGVGAVFLYRTDSSIGILDGLVTNPRVGLRARAKFVRDGVMYLETLGLELNIRHFAAYTPHRGVQKSLVRGLRYITTTRREYCLTKKLR
jgi:hypothetical protein